MKTVTLDCTNIQTPAQLHQRLAMALSFPDWYGHNLDALYDCLTEISEEICLVLAGWDTLDSFREGFLQTMEDASQDNPFFICTKEE